jgi:hypothetical protein
MIIVLFFLKITLLFIVYIVVLVELELGNPTG